MRDMLTKYRVSRRTLKYRITAHGGRTLTAFKRNTAPADTDWQPLFASLPVIDPRVQVSVYDLMLAGPSAKHANSRKRFAAVRRIARAARYARGLDPIPGQE